MLNRLCHVSRCPLDLCRFQQPLQKTCQYGQKRFSSEAALSNSSTHEQSFTACAYKIEGPAIAKRNCFTIQGSAPDRRKRKHATSSVATRAKSGPQLPPKLHRQVYRTRNRAPVKGPVQRPWRLYKPWASQAVGARDDSSIYPQESRLRVQHEPKYLESPRLVSLASWSSGSSNLVQLPDLYEPSRTIDALDTRWSSRLMCVETGQRLRHWSTRYIERFVRRYAGLHVRSKVLHQTWMHHSGADRMDRWQDTMLWCMQNSPKRALMTLLATLKGERLKPPRHMVLDSLQFLARHFLHRVHTVDPFAIDIIWHLTNKFVERSAPGNLQSCTMSQEVVQLLLKHCGHAQVVSFYEKLVTHRAELRVNTLLHFLERFVEMGRLDLSMKLLRQITHVIPPDHRSDMSDALSKDQVQSGCVKMLRTRWTDRDLYSVQSKILAQMLEMGIRPGLPMYNAILLNMVEGRDFDTAWRTYDIAKQSDHFTTDSTTYGILIKGARLSGSTNVLEKVLSDINENPDMLQDLRLFGDFLNAICTFSPGNEFPTMLEIYKQHLDLRPLQQLGLCGPEKIATPNVAVAGKWPTKHILGQMILAYNRTQPSSRNLIHRYNQYWAFVQQGHPLIAPLASNDYVANSFLMAFSKRAETLDYCTVVMQHMFTKPTSPDAPKIAAPTVRTWSILMAGYNLHHQNKAAEKVLTMMRARGIEPDLITWNTLIGGYASIQDVEGAVGAMGRLEADGFTPNSRTLKAIGRLWKREKLLEMLKMSLETGEMKREQVKLSVRELVDPDEVQSMAEGWEADAEKDKGMEIEHYVQMYHKEDIRR